MRWPKERDNGLIGNLKLSLALIGMVPSRPNAAVLTGAFPTVFSINDDVQYVEGSETSPPAFIVRNPERSRALVVMMGMTSSQIAEKIVRGWLSSQGTTPRSPAPYDYGIFSIITGVGFPSNEQWDELTLIGHSLGGAIVTAAAPLIIGNFGRGGTATYVYTFGAPKALITRSLQDDYDDFYVRRCFLNADPVPTLPPGGSYIGDLAVVGTADARRFTSWMHPGMGLLMSNNEFPQPAINPFNDNFIRIPGSLTAWLTGITAFGNAEHSLTAYTTVANSIPNGAGGFDDDALPVLHPRPQTITPTQHNQALDTMVGVQNSIVSLDPNGAARGIQQNFPRRPGIRFHGTKYRGHRALFYGDEFITFVKTRRLQISLVRYLNRQLRGQ